MHSLHLPSPICLSIITYTIFNFLLNYFNDKYVSIQLKFFVVLEKNSYLIHRFSFNFK